MDQRPLWTRDDERGVAHVKNPVRWLVVSGVFTVTLTMLSTTLAAPPMGKECLQLGYQNNGKWVYYHASIDSVNGDRWVIRYDNHEGRLDLRVTEKQKSGGQDVYLMSGRWSEDRGRASGRAFLKMEVGSHHASGWYMNGDTGPKYDLALRECQ